MEGGREPDEEGDHGANMITPPPPTQKGTAPTLSKWAKRSHGKDCYSMSAFLQWPMSRDCRSWVPASSRFLKPSRLPLLGPPSKTAGSSGTQETPRQRMCMNRYARISPG